tara:strand:- start:190 stop:426 length:237 start_codon:yes stop_codon:yes gene_type:complete
MMPPDVESLNLSYDDVLGTYEWREVVDEYNDLLAEVKRLRKGIWDAIYLFQEAGNPKMSDKKRLETICEFLVEVYDND